MINDFLSLEHLGQETKKDASQLLAIAKSVVQPSHNLFDSFDFFCAYFQAKREPRKRAKQTRAGVTQVIV